MPGEISALATRNFDGANLISPNNVGELMQKEGRFTLDDAGRLTVINPPARRDNGFVRFFKGLFSSSYRAEQRMLDRMEVLGRNASFNAELRAAIGRFRPGGMERLDGFAWNRTFNTVLTRIQPSGTEPLSMGELRQAAAEATHFTEAMRAPSSAFSALDGSVAPVLTERGPMSLEEFISANRTEVTDLPNFDDVARAVCTNVLQGKDMGSLLLNDDCSRFTALMAKSELTHQEKQEVRGLRSKAEQNVVNAMASFASKALEEGAEPAKLANHLGGALVALGRGNSGAGMILRNQLSDPAGFAAANRAAQPAAPRLPETPHSAAALRAMGGDKAKAARLVLYCEAHNISLQQLESSLRMAKNMNKLLDTGNNRDNLLACDAALKDLYREMQAQKAAKPDFGADDYMSLFGAAAFASWVEGDGRPLDFSALRTLCTACMDINDEGDSRFELNSILHPLALLMHAAEAGLTTVQQAVEGQSNVTLDRESPAQLRQALKDLSRRTELDVRIEDFLHGRRMGQLLDGEGLPSYGALRSDLRAFLEDNMKLAGLRAGVDGLDEAKLEETAVSLLPTVCDPAAAQRQAVESFVGHMQATPVDSGAVLRDMVQIYRGLSASVRSSSLGDEAMSSLLATAFRSLDRGSLEAAYGALTGDPAAKNLIALTGGFAFTGAMSEVLAGTPDSLMTETECRAVLSMFGQAWGDTLAAMDEVLGRSGEDNPSPAQVMFEQASMTEAAEVPLELHEQVRSLLNEMGLNGDAHPLLLR